MRKNFARIIFILDQSSSMGHLRQAAINAYNEFLDEQRKVPGEADIQLVLFDTKIEKLVLHGLANAPYIDQSIYDPNGMTALYDAIGITIKEQGELLAERDEGDRPDKVIFAIFTDGEENSSQQYSGEEGRLAVAAMIKHQQEVYSWEFLFLATNIDAPMVATSLNIPSSNAFNYANNAAGLEGAVTLTSSNVARMRTGTGDAISWENDNANDHSRHADNQ